MWLGPEACGNGKIAKAHADSHIQGRMANTCPGSIRKPREREEWTGRADGQRRSLLARWCSQDGCSRQDSTLGKDWWEPVCLLDTGLDFLSVSEIKADGMF